VAADPSTENNDSERNLSDFDYQAHNYHEYAFIRTEVFRAELSQPPTSSADLRVSYLAGVFVLAIASQSILAQEGSSTITDDCS